MTLLGSIITLCLVGATDSSLNEVSEVLSDSSLLSIISEARQLVDTAYLQARRSLKKKLEEKLANPMDFLKHLKDPVGRTRSAVRAADYMETTLKLLKRKLHLSGEQRFNVTDLLSRKQKEMIFRGTGCYSQTRPIKCPKQDIYRTITGECNNRRHPHLGSSNRGFARWLPAVYEDGVSVPRGASEGRHYNGFPLPLVRKVSNEIAHTANENVTADQELSLVFMHWGQWVNHDIDLAPASGEGASLELLCHTDCAFKPPCFPIKLMAVNQHFTDAGLELLPFENVTKSVCVLTNPGANIPCFRAGDKRVTENLGLSAMHTIFLREHNRLVTELRGLNPHWDGEKLYQESRKIVIAINQIITYRDYLPLLLAEETSKWIPQYRGYDEEVDPRASNVFSLAFRFGHTSVQPFVSRLDESFQPLGSYSHVPLHLTFCATWRIIMEGGIDPLVRGMVVDHAKKMEQNQLMVEELQNHLFEQLEVMGLDLAAMNMQRGRDHGLPGYNAWRGFCGLSQPRTVEEFSEVLGNPKLAKKFLDVYGTPDNIDLWIGAVAEPVVPQGRVGPLLSCIIGTQFRNLRDGDRFWWENPGVFTPQQLQALRKITLSKVFCDNTRIQKIPRDVFRINSYPEDFTDCQEIDALDLSPWKDEPESGTKGSSPAAQTSVGNP
ncbi:eosinophil peroxidase-like [Manacus vitellinus]|uniref:eosinophil peroxidase-like n=1 Tax=Manacus vitellinus TaxID=328815 RepID=UPI00115F425C|nr:eosinophil peroxidase-like [Manacus vitellinus]